MVRPDKVATNDKGFGLRPPHTAGMRSVGPHDAG